MTGSDHDAVESLYPFLYAQSSDIDAVLEQVRQSTVDKANEIISLRATVLEQYGSTLTECATAMAERFVCGGRLFAFGNGGSSTDAQDVATQFLSPPADMAPMPAFALTGDIAVVTALGNDIGFDVVFARQLAAFGRAEDIAVGLSTSGNSDNLIQGFEEAARRGMLTVGLAGYSGGKMAESAAIDYLFVAPSPSVHRIQEAQTTIYHVLSELAAERLPDGAEPGTAKR